MDPFEIVDHEAHEQKCTACTEGKILKPCSCSEDGRQECVYCHGSGKVVYTCDVCGGDGVAKIPLKVRSD